MVLELSYIIDIERIDFMDKLRFGVIGLRNFGRGAHIKGIEANDNAELVAVCDVLADLAEQTGKEHGVDFYTDYKELLKRDDIDAVTVATPDQVHEEITVAALRAGKHVLCEKPMALSVEKCINMINASKESGKKLMVGQICRYAPGFVLAKKLVEDGQIGELYFVESEYAHDYSKLTDATWRFDPKSPREPVTGGGCHAVDLLRWIAGNPTETFSYSNHKVLKSWPVNDATIAVLKFPNDVIGKVYTSIGCRRNYTMRTVLYGTHGTIIVDNKTPWLSLYREKTGEDEFFYGKDSMTIEEKIPISIESHNVVSEIADFCREVLGDLPITTDGVEGASTVAVCEAIVKSSQSGNREIIKYNFA